LGYLGFRDDVGAVMIDPLVTAAYLLASMVYAEARGESVRGQLAVMQIAINRADGDERNLHLVLTPDRQFARRAPDLETVRLVELFLQGEAVADRRLHDRRYVHFYSGPPTEVWQLACNDKIQIGAHIFCKGVAE
jgi:hypothetical protein